MSESNSLVWIPPTAEREILARNIPKGKAIAVDISGERYIVARDSRLAESEELLLKGAAELKARAQPYRISPGLLSMGAYQGIKEPRFAALTTAKILKQVPMKNPIIGMILRHRQNQASSFTKRPDGDRDTGFRVRMKQKTAHPSAAAKKRMMEIEDIILNGGYVTPNMYTGEPGAWDAEQTEKAMNFTQFIRTVLWDTLTIDAMAYRIEVGTNNKKYPVVWFNPIDASLIRRATPAQQGSLAVQNSAGAIQPYKPEIRQDLKMVSWVMLDPYGMSVQREFEWDEIAYGVRNPRSDQWTLGYGCSELEMMIDIITGILHGIKFNTEFFDSSHIPPGLLVLTGGYSEEALQDFREQLRWMVGGPGQFWTMPILADEMPGGTGASYFKMREEGVGMFWREWLLFCATIASGLYGLDPGEINFMSFGAPNATAQISQPLGKIEYAQESGFEPLMQHLAQFMNDGVVSKFDDGEFLLEWTGLSDKDVLEEVQEREGRMSSAITTPNMERARRDERPIVDPLDKDLWLEIKEQVDAELTKEEGDNPEASIGQDLYMQIIEQQYLEAGGRMAQWPDAPVGNALAMQAWMIEHGLQIEEQIQLMQAEAELMGTDGSDSSDSSGSDSTTGSMNKQVQGARTREVQKKPSDQPSRKSAHRKNHDATKPFRKTIEDPEIHKVIEVIVRRAE